MSERNLVVLKPRPRTGYHYIAVPNGRGRYTLWHIAESMAPTRSQVREYDKKGFVYGEGKALVMGVGLTRRECKEIIRKQRGRQ